MPCVYAESRYPTVQVSHLVLLETGSCAIQPHQLYIYRQLSSRDPERSKLIVTFPPTRSLQRYRLRYS